MRGARGAACQWQAFSTDRIEDETLRLAVRAPPKRKVVRFYRIGNARDLELSHNSKSLFALFSAFFTSFYDFLDNSRQMDRAPLVTRLDSLIKDYEFPRVTFHSFRHASITYKLKFSGGNVKAVQGDSDHADARMVLNLYSHFVLFAHIRHPCAAILCLLDRIRSTSDIASSCGSILSVL